MDFKQSNYTKYAKINEHLIKEYNKENKYTSL